ncbi:hypothetical protein BOW53_01920 [Solemya pervernicosa gill symbiont]|uniref:Cyclic nucleotide-binding domain-containing protein n=2 Tax=Gammaproteobacteria incertae sedis TaxID=118884 RepID=A0A1T2LA19_9GAMM|nr:hypothetical protein BOW53_01920 [Solemya pervernicosa gill symbiont]
MVGVNYRMASLLFLVLVTAVSALGLQKLRVETDFSSLIAANDPKKMMYDQVAAEFGSDNRSLIYVRDVQLWTPEKLASLERLHRALESLDFVERVEDLFTLRSIRDSDGAIDSRLLIAEAPESEEDARSAYENASYNPLILGNYLSNDGRVVALMVSVKAPPDERGFDHRVNGALEQIVNNWKGEFDELFQVGPPRINAEMQASLYDDLVLLAPLSMGLLIVTIVLLLRSFMAAIIPVITSILSLVWAFGLMGWSDIPINILSAMIPSLVVVIGSTEDTHMMAAYFQGVSESRGDRRAATRFMMRHMGVPLLLTILTTSLGFVSNIFNGIGLIQDFAIASAVAILANGVITVLMVPMLLDRIGPRGSSVNDESGRVGGLPGVVVRLFGFSQQRFSSAILVLTTLLCAFFIYHASQLHVTNDPLTYFHSDRPLIQDVNRVQQDLSGIKLFFVTLESKDERAFLEPKNLRRLTEIQEFIEEQGVFDRSVSLADQLSLVNREFHRGDEEYRVVPNTRELVAQYLLFFHRNDLRSYVSNDFRRTNIVVRHNVSDSATLNRSIKELEAVAEDIAGGDIKAYVVGENLMINESAELLMSAQVKSLGLLLIAIFLIMSTMFTSFMGGVIALIPAMIPIVLMFGVMGLFDIPLNPGTAMVAVIAIGIAVDGTIHLFSRYNELCRRTSDYEEAVRQTVKMEATPVVTTSLALSLGFGVLLLSNFTLIAQFGALSALTMLFSIFANLLITPIIMTRVRVVALHQIIGLSASKEVLQGSPLFKGMSEYQIRKAILISEMHDFTEGEMVIRQGDVGRSMYLILSGEAEVLRRVGGDEQCVAQLKPGEVFGEIGFVRETTRTAGVRAASDLHMLRFDFEKIGKDLKYFPNIVAKINFNISCILGERLVDVMESQAKQQSSQD